MMKNNKRVTELLHLSEYCRGFEKPGGIFLTTGGTEVHSVFLVFSVSPVVNIG